MRLRLEKTGIETETISLYFFDVLCKAEDHSAQICRIWLIERYSSSLLVVVNLLQGYLCMVSHILEPPTIPQHISIDSQLGEFSGNNYNSETSPALPLHQVHSTQRHERCWGREMLISTMYSMDLLKIMFSQRGMFKIS